MHPLCIPTRREQMTETASQLKDRLGEVTIDAMKSHARLVRSGAVRYDRNRLRALSVYVPSFATVSCSPVACQARRVAIHTTLVKWKALPDWVTADCPLRATDLMSAMLAETMLLQHLRGRTHPSEANLHGADLSGATLHGSTQIRAYLTGVKA